MSRVPHGTRDIRHGDAIVVTLLHVVLYEKERRLEVAVADKVGRKRVVTIYWHTKEFTPIPDSWLDQVEKELEYQDAEEQTRLQGRALFR